LSLRVLLLSPLQGLDPPNGDVTYTSQLLVNPPRGVEYTTYAQALADGHLRERFRRSSHASSAAAWFSARTLREGAVNRLRRRGILFREPFRYFYVRPGAFDLVHCHVFSIRVDGADTPVLMSNAAPIEWLYRDGLGWSARRVDWARRADRALAAATGIDHIAYRLERTARLVCFTNRLRDWYVSRGVVRQDRVDVVPCSVSVPASIRRTRTGRPARVAFIGDFDVKGGEVALAAFEIVRSERPDARLLVIGSPPRLDPSAAAARGIEWLGRVPRSQLLDELLPSIDVLAYPSRFDGLPLTLLEAMACGVPVAGSDYQAIPEILGDGQAGLVSPVGDEGRLAQIILRLLEPATNAKYAAAAHHRALSCYSTEVVRPKLLASYEAALAMSSV
jgi:glycosyltransferase involved in cell wall biosynthesis